MPQKAEVVLSILRGDSSVAQAAEAAGVPESDVRDWMRRYLRAAESRLRGDGPACRTVTAGRLRSENEAMRAAVREMHRQMEFWRASAAFSLGPFHELEAIRLDATMTVRGFCALIGTPPRSYFRRLALLRSGEPIGGTPRAAPSTRACVPIVAVYLEKWPEYGHRRLHALMAADGHVTSPSTVLRAMRLLGGTTRTEQRGGPDESGPRHTD